MYRDADPAVVSNYFLYTVCYLIYVVKYIANTTIACLGGLKLQKIYLFVCKSWGGNISSYPPPINNGAVSFRKDDEAAAATSSPNSSLSNTNLIHYT